jgi:hypothetical protein
MAGLELSAIPPDYEIYIDDGWGTLPQGLHLFDAERNVAIAYVNTLRWRLGGPSTEEMLDEFAELNRNMTVGVFRNSGHSNFASGPDVFGDEWNEEELFPLEDMQGSFMLSGEVRARYLTTILNRISRQVEAFVYELQEEGILEIPSD